MSATVLSYNGFDLAIKEYIYIIGLGHPLGNLLPPFVLCRIFNNTICLRDTPD